MKEVQVVLEGDKVVDFRLPLFLEATVDCSTESEETRDKLIDWCEDRARFSHQGEFEFVFPLMPTYKNYIPKMEVPKQLQNVFRAALKEAEKQEDENGTVYFMLRIKE